MAKKVNKQMVMFEEYSPVDWAPPSSFPDLSGDKRVWLDLETDGVDKRKSKPVGIALSTETKSWYFPFAHEGGGNLDEDNVRRWAKDQLRNKRIANLNTGFDAAVARNWDLDLEAQGNKIHDVAHAAALLNERRYGGFNLDDLGHEYVDRGKVESDVKPEDIHKVHSSLVGPYAEGDTALARDIDLKQISMMEVEDLMRVMDMEDRLLWANNHMERSAARLDVPKLTSWIDELDQEYSEAIMKIWTSTGVKLRPNAADSWDELFTVLGVQKPEYTGTKEKKIVKSQGKFGVSFMKTVPKPSGFTGEFLFKVENELVALGLRGRRIDSLQSKYFKKYDKARKEDILGFNLYQLRAGEEDFGTVVGRYSSSNINVQQVFKPENQIRRFGDGHIVRELFIPDEGFDMFAADGSQLQFRLFAHYSQDPELLAAYQRDLHLKPGDKAVDFHEMVATLFVLTRQAAKHNNFAMVLGMGNEKLCDRLGKSCICGINWLTRRNKAIVARRNGERYDPSNSFAENANHRKDCPAIEGNKMAADYNEKFPAAKRTMKEVTEVAQTRGYLKTLLGRRQRFVVNGEVVNHKFYSGFASLLQGSEADVVKTKILTLYDNMHSIGIHKLRFPVHDELVGDILREEESRKRLREALAEQELKLSVPIIWNMDIGLNWAEAH